MNHDAGRHARRRPGSVAVLAWLRMARFTNKEQFGLGEADNGLPSSGTTTIPAYIRAARS